MSTNYFPYCVDCKSEHHIEQDKMLGECRALVRDAASIAALVPLFDRLAEAGADPRLHLSWETTAIDVRWFRDHAGHHLAVRDEYGRNDDECGESYQCAECKHPHRFTCRRSIGHDGGHDPKRDDGRG